jgi:5'-deoxynucleotidase YfbR-like HD superfamily hydrolase
LTSSACSYSSAQEIRELWMEYENNASLEAKVVKDFDKVQFIHQVRDIMTTSV